VETEKCGVQKLKKRGVQKVLTRLYLEWSAQTVFVLHAEILLSELSYLSISNGDCVLTNFRHKLALI